MTHNRFNVEEDLVRPLIKFLHQARLDLACRSEQYTRRHASTRTDPEAFVKYTDGSPDNPGFLRSSSLRLQHDEDSHRKPLQSSEIKIGRDRTVVKKSVGEGGAFEEELKEYGIDLLKNSKGVDREAPDSYPVEMPFSNHKLKRI